MVDTSMADLVGKLKPLINQWAPSDQVECVDLCIAYWSANNWGKNELTKCESELNDSFTASNLCTATIE